jgi:general secretion pathway protein G
MMTLQRALPKTLRGFTLIELLVVMAIMGVLLAISAPRYFDSVDRAKEATLRANLRMVRENIDKYKADTGRYPETLQALVTDRYLAAIPMDPITDQSSTWVLIEPPDGLQGVYEIRSGAAGLARDGTSFTDW